MKSRLPDGLHTSWCTCHRCQSAKTGPRPSRWRPIISVLALIGGGLIVFAYALVTILPALRSGGR